MYQRFRVPVGVLICAQIGVIVLLVVDVMTADDDTAPLRSDLRTIFGIVILTAAGFVFYRLARNWADKTDRRLERIERIWPRGEEPTVPIHPVRVVAMAGIPTKTEPQDDAKQMSGYAKGYVDGLARKPIAGKVLPIDRARDS